MAAVIFNKAQFLKNLNQGPVFAITVLKDRKYSSETTPYNPTQLKRGTGGRSSFSGIIATVFGATGFTGRYVCNRLGKIGSQIIIPYRGDQYECRNLKLAGDLGQVLYYHFNLKDEESIAKAMKYSNVVINLIGRDYETKNYKFHDVHVTGAATIARIAKELGVPRFIHVSALNASPNPQKVVLKAPSQFYISKYEGEKAVLKEFPEATIFRPSDIYGQEDRFLRYYAHAWRRQHFGMPLWHKGDKTVKQPVYVGDFAGAIVAAIKDPETAGKVYQAVGPKRYCLGDLVDWFYKIIKKDDENFKRYDMKLDPIFWLKVELTNRISTNQPLRDLHWEKIEREHVTDVVVPGVPTLEDLGITLTHLENQAPWELRPFTAALYHGSAADEPFPNPDPPKTVN